MARVAIVYDRVNKWGGAERVLLTLHEMFPEAPLYTSVYDAKGAAWAKVFPKIHTSFLQRVPFASGNHELLGTFMPLVFESFDFSGYDLVISVTSEAAKGVIVRPETKHICICLTPTRYLWSGYDFYFRNPILRFLSKPVVSYLRIWDKMAAKRPDILVSISSEVKSRIKRYYDRDSIIIFPPVDTNNLQFSIHNLQKNKDYYLVVSRLVPYKRVDLVIEALNKLKLPLVVVGTGSDEIRLKFDAKNNIKFVGKVSEKELTSYYKGAQALIMPQEEDFGLVGLEAQAHGTPVIAFKSGGALDYVVDGKTGIFFANQTSAALIGAIEKFNRLNQQKMQLECFKNAENFSKEKFKEKFLRLTAK